MSGVQFSSFYFAKELKKYKEINYQILLPKKGEFSELCHVCSIPYKVYNAMPYLSTSFSFFTDSFRIPNPLAWVFNMFSITYNGIIIRPIIKMQPKAVVLSKGLLSHFVSIIACIDANNFLIWHLQDLVSNRYGGLLRFLFNFFAKNNPNSIICDGKSIKSILTTRIKTKCKIVLNGIDENEFQRDEAKRKNIRHEFDIPSSAYVIGHVGRITPWKGQEILLDAFIKYSVKNTNAYLLLIGDSMFDNDKYYKKLKSKISDAGLNHRIKMPGFRSDLDAIYSALDLYIYPSLEKDTSPLALLSALVSGLPVFISRIPSLKEIGDIVPALRSFDVSNKDELINILVEFEDSIKRNKIGPKIQKEAIISFSISRHTEDLLSIIRSSIR